MIVTVRGKGDVEAVRRALVARGLWVDRLEGGDRVQFAVGASSAHVEAAQLLEISGVENVTEARSQHPLVDRQGPFVIVRGIRIGRGAPPVILAGPCAIESEEQIDRIARKVAANGATFLRGGAFKPRSSPYSFRGHGENALRWMRQAADRHGLGMVTEAMGSEEAPAIAEITDIIQIGSRNMHNYSLLERVAQLGRPVMLKRGMAATIEEWLAAGEYCLLAGAPGVLFCERGIRSFEPSSRNLLDINAIALLSEVIGVPVIADPSHASGRRDLVPRLAKASLAAGAHGLLIETHDDPGSALSDGPQAVPPELLRELLEGGPR